MNLQDLKNKKTEELLKQAESLDIENPSSYRKQDLMFTILKEIASSLFKIKSFFKWHYRGTRRQIHISKGFDFRINVNRQHND